MAVVLDTRYLMAHTFPPSTKEREMIASFTPRIATEGLLASTLSIVEFVKVAGLRIGREAAVTRLRVWQKAGLQFVAVSEGIGYRAGEMALSHPELPTGDVIIAATAQEFSAAVITDDPDFDSLGVKRDWFR
jgi:predicted nucleic acid-binding protein